MNIRRKILEFIVDQKAQWHASPTRDDLSKLLGMTSDNLEMQIKQLELEGLVIIGKDGELAISPGCAPDDSQRVRWRGVPTHPATCVVPREHEAFIQLDLRQVGVSLPANMEGLQVLDESMTDAGIRKGDIAITETRSPLRGEIIAVEIKHRMVLRRYLTIAGIAHLLAENPTHPDLQVAWEHPVRGVLWGLIRTGISRPTQASKGATAAIYASSRKPLPESCLPAVSLQSSLSIERRVGKPPSLKRQKPSADGWPLPPSGCELNDESGTQYLTTKSTGCGELT